MLRKRASAATSFNEQFGGSERRTWADRALVDDLIARATGHSQRQSFLSSASALRNLLLAAQRRADEGEGSGASGGASGGRGGSSAELAEERTPPPPPLRSFTYPRASIFPSAASLSRLVARQRLKGVTFAEKLTRKEGAAFARALTSFLETEKSTLLAALAQHDGSILDRRRAGRASGERIHAWLAGAEDHMRMHALWRHESEEEFANTIHELEARLFEDLFQPLMRCAEDSDHDRALMRRLDLLAKFVTAEHLEAPALIHGPGKKHFLAASELLRKTHCCKTPRDKIGTIAEASRELVNALQKVAKAAQRQASSEDGAVSFSAGADDLLPCMILTVLRAMPPWMHSEVKFIELFCPPSILLGEGGYVLTQICSAKMFLERLDASNLSGIDDETFRAAVAKAEESGAIWETIHDIEDDGNHIESELDDLTNLSLEDYKVEWAALSSPEACSRAEELSTVSHGGFATNEQKKNFMMSVHPTFPEDVLLSILQENKGNMNAAIEALSGWNCYFDTQSRPYLFQESTGAWRWLNESVGDTSAHDHQEVAEGVLIPELLEDLAVCPPQPPPMDLASVPTAVAVATIYSEDEAGITTEVPQ